MDDLAYTPAAETFREKIFGGANVTDDLAYVTAIGMWVKNVFLRYDGIGVTGIYIVMSNITLFIHIGDNSLKTSIWPCIDVKQMIKASDLIPSMGKIKDSTITFSWLMKNNFGIIDAFQIDFFDIFKSRPSYFQAKLCKGYLNIYMLDLLNNKKALRYYGVNW